MPACDEPWANRSGSNAAADAARAAAAATARSRKCGSQPTALHSPQPATAVSSTNSGMASKLRTAFETLALVLCRPLVVRSVFVEPDRVLDQEVHARRHAEHRTGDHAPRVG